MKSSNIYTPIIQNMGVMTNILLSKAIDLGAAREIAVLREVDRQLIEMLHNKKSEFDFIDRISNGKVLLVGEGNFSFSYSLSVDQKITPANLMATSFEEKSELSDNAIINIEKLCNIGVLVINGVDATNLSKHFSSEAFDHIIFQFPNVRSREPIEGHNPNFILVRDFLKSAKTCLNSAGEVIITVVDTSYYRGIFQFEQAALDSGFSEPEIYKFNPLLFPDYIHTMTNEEASAIEDYNKFSTLIFKPYA